MSSTARPIALITGANKGLGFTLGRTLAASHGFHVILASRTIASGASAVSQLQSEGFSVEGLAIDVTSDASITSAAETVTQKHGKIDVLVNNAGILVIAGDAAPAAELRSKYQEGFNTNLFGSAVVTASFIPLLSKSALPHIVFLSSTMGSITARLDPKDRFAAANVDIYSASKAALNMLCATYARREEYKSWKINSACPGWVRTDINSGAGEKDVEEAMGNLVRLCTMGEDGETGTFTDDAGTVAW